MGKKGIHDLLYVLSCCEGKYLKIGICKKGTLDRRVATLQTGNPCRISVEFSEERLSAKDAEQYLHQCFSEKRYLGEWFTDITLHEIRVKLMLFHDQD